MPTSTNGSYTLRDAQEIEESLRRSLDDRRVQLRCAENAIAVLRDALPLIADDATRDRAESAITAYDETFTLAGLRRAVEVEQRRRECISEKDITFVDTLKALYWRWESLAIALGGVDEAKFHRWADYRDLPCEATREAVGIFYRQMRAGLRGTDVTAYPLQADTARFGQLLVMTPRDGSAANDDVLTDAD